MIKPQALVLRLCESLYNLKSPRSGYWFTHCQSLNHHQTNPVGLDYNPLRHYMQKAPMQRLIMQDIFSFFRSPSLMRISMPKLSKRSTNKTIILEFLPRKQSRFLDGNRFFIWLRYLFECNDLTISDGLRFFAKQTILNFVC